MSTQPYTGENIESLISTVQSSERTAFLENRRKFIGGSDSASMFNEGYGCFRRLVMDKRGVKDDYGHSDRTQRLFERGNDLENTIAEKFLRHANEKLEAAKLPEINIRRQQSKTHKNFPFMGVNIDRQIIGVSFEALIAICPDLKDRISAMPGPGVLECKSANEWVFKRAMHEGLQPDYIIQMQHALAVTGYQWGIFAILCTSGPDEWELLWFGVYRDEKFIAEIIARAQDTWKMVEDFTLPLPEKLDIKDKRCGACIKRKTCRGDELVKLTVNDGNEEDDAKVTLTYDIDDSLAEIVNDRNTAKFAVEQAEVVLEAIDAQLKKKIGDRQGVEVPSAGVRILFKQQKDAEAVDTKAVKSELPLITSAIGKIIAGLKSGKVQEAVLALEMLLPQLVLKRFVKARKGSRPMRVMWI